MLTFLGANLELTPAAKGMRGAIEKAEEILSENPNAMMLQQFKNPSNPEIHRGTTAEEIWADTDGKVDAVVSGVGTGGTFSGCARVLKARKPGFKMFAASTELPAEPAPGRTARVTVVHQAGGAAAFGISGWV